MIASVSHPCHRTTHVTVDFIGPRHPLNDLAAVKDAAAHDRAPSAVLSLGQDVFLVNGKALDTTSPKGVHVGDRLSLSGIRNARVLAVDDGRGEVSPFVGRSLSAAARFLDQKAMVQALQAYDQALRLGQDSDEELAIADHAEAHQVPAIENQAYIRAVDLAPDARKTLAVAEHAADHHDVDDADLGYGSAIARTTDNKLLLVIAASADAHGRPDEAKAARAKAAS